MCINWANPIDKLKDCKIVHFDMNYRRSYGKSTQKLPKIEKKYIKKYKLEKNHTQIPKRNVKR